MKKTYINLKIDVVKLNINQQLLTASEVGLGEPGSANGAESRRGYGFDDEE